MGNLKTGSLAMRPILCSHLVSLSFRVDFCVVGFLKPYSGNLRLIKSVVLFLVINIFLLFLISRTLEIVNTHYSNLLSFPGNLTNRMVSICLTVIVIYL